MSTPGRNEPCHCGSGKKYKKCCLEKDTATANAATWATNKKKEREQWEPEEDELKYMINEEEEERDCQEIDEEDGGEYENDDKDDNDDFNDTDDFGIEKHTAKEQTISNKDYPVISAADEKLVDEWWEGLDYDKEPREVRNYIEKFIHEHPQLVENLGLEEEVLFELCAKYNRAGEVDEYIHFLLRIRKEFPGVYERSAGFYDSDIIAWLIANNREGEIENYLGYFKKYPIEFIDQLFDVVRLLEATDNIEPLISLVSATFKRIAFSNEIFNGNRILIPLVSQTMSNYLNKGVAEIDVASFIDDLSKVLAPVSLDKTDETLNHWRATFNSTLRPFTNWPVDIPKKKSQIEKRYENIVDNFSRYLHEQTGISWVSARYYSAQMASYFREYIKAANGKIKKQFDFAERTMDKIVGSVSKKMLWLDCTQTVSTQQAIHHFAGYLQECGNITEEEKLIIQRDCTILYNVAYSSVKKEFTEAACFRTFPFL